MTPGLLLLQSGAIAASLLQVLIGVRQGLFGSGEQATLGQALTLVSIALVYAWWPSPLVAATSGVRGAALALVILPAAWTFLAQGVSVLFFCAPPCAVAAPFADIATITSIMLGAAAAWSAWRAYRRMVGPTQWAPAATAVVLIVVSFALQAASANVSR